MSKTRALNATEVGNMYWDAVREMQAKGADDTAVRQDYSLLDRKGSGCRTLGLCEVTLTVRKVKATEVSK